MKLKEINIKNRTNYFFDDMINVKNFDPNQMKANKKSYKNITIYYIGYITIKNLSYVNINNVNPLYFIKVNKYDEKYMKIKFKSDDNLPLTKILKLHNLKIVVRSVFQEDIKYYT